MILKKAKPQNDLKSMKGNVCCKLKERNIKEKKQQLLLLKKKGKKLRINKLRLI